MTTTRKLQAHSALLWWLILLFAALLTAMMVRPAGGEHVDWANLAARLFAG